MPKCRDRLKVTMQELLEGMLSEEKRKKLQASTITDRLHVECSDCGFTFSILFHFSSGYQKALDELSSKIFDGFLRKDGG